MRPECSSNLVFVSPTINLTVSGTKCSIIATGTFDTLITALDYSTVVIDAEASRRLSMNYEYSRISVRGNFSSVSIAGATSFFEFDNFTADFATIRHSLGHLSISNSIFRKGILAVSRGSVNLEDSAVSLNFDLLSATLVASDLRIIEGRRRNIEGSLSDFKFGKLNCVASSTPLTSAPYSTLVSDRLRTKDTRTSGAVQLLKQIRRNGDVQDKACARFSVKLDRSNLQI